MIYTVKTEYETLHSVVFNFYKSINMLNNILILNQNLQTTFLKVNDKVILPNPTYNNIQAREKLY